MMFRVFGLMLAMGLPLATDKSDNVATIRTATDPGRIEVPASHRSGSSAPTGLQHLEGTGLRGLFYVPHSYRPNESLPVLILLHGGGHHASDWFGSYGRRAEKGRFIIIAPDSFGRTWGSTGDFKPDVARINGALATVFSHYAIDPDRIIVGGFSDGASYALSFGLFNGDRVRGVIAFSPGYLLGQQGRGHPSFFISHGLQDTMLPIEGSRSYVDLLRKGGYTVVYREFSGGHEVPPSLSDVAMSWVDGIFKTKK
jgi:phospholipase/carboxylesterase